MTDRRGDGAPPGPDSVRAGRWRRGATGRVGARKRFVQHPEPDDPMLAARAYCSKSGRTALSCSIA